MTQPSYKLVDCIRNALEEEAGERVGFRFMSLLAVAYAQGGGCTGFGIVRKENAQLLEKNLEKAIEWYNRIIQLDKVPAVKKIFYREVVARLSNELESLEDSTLTIWAD